MNEFSEYVYKILPKIEIANLFSESNLKIVIPLFTGIGIILFLAAYLLNKNYESSMCGKLIWFRPAKYLFDFIAGSLVGFQIITIERIDNMSGKVRLGIFLLSSIVVAVVVNKLLERYDKE